MKFQSNAYTAASGSIGGTTYSRNRFGLYVRSRATPTNPNTLRQQNVRGYFGTAVQYWTSTLTAAQRLAWKTYADNTPSTDAFGNAITLTGQSMFIRHAVARLQIGGGIVAAAPTIFDTGEPITELQVTTLGTVGALGISLAGTDLSATAIVDGAASNDGDLALYLGAPINATRSFFKGPYQLAAVTSFIATDTTLTFTQAFTDLLSGNGDPAEGQYRGVRLRMIYDDGRLSQPYQLIAPVVAETV